jgi:hypothetical protein
LEAIMPLPEPKFNVVKTARTDRAKSLIADMGAQQTYRAEQARNARREMERLYAEAESDENSAEMSVLDQQSRELARIIAALEAGMKVVKGP